MFYGYPHQVQVRMNAGEHSTMRHPDKGVKSIFKLMIHYNYRIMRLLEPK